MDEEERAQLAAKYERSALALPPLRIPRNKLSPRAQLILLCAASFLFLLSTIRIPLQRCDDIYFFVGAKSIAAGKGFSDISRPESPPQLKYPPIRAYLQVPLLALTENTIRPLRVVGMAAIVSSLALIYPMLVTRIGHRASMWCLALTVFNPVMVRSANFEGANVLGLLWGLTFLLVARAVQRPDDMRSGAWAGVAIALCFYTHRMGTLLLPLAFAYLFLVKRRRAAWATLIVSAALCIPWQVRGYLYSGHWISPEYEMEFGDRIRGDAPADSFVVATVKHLAINAATFPEQVGYGIFPWWKASGGAPWQFLEKTGLAWVARGFAWFLSGAIMVGYLRTFRRDATFVEYFFVPQTLLLLSFFVGFGYYLMILPWFFLWLWRGLQPMIARAGVTRLAAAGATLLLLTALAKDIKAFWLVPFSWEDRDPRWAWIAQAVPPEESVCYEGLQNYMMAPLRWYDTRRMAVGASESEIAREAATPSGKWRWISVPTDGPSARLLAAGGWKAVVREQGRLPTIEELGSDMLDSQKQFLLGQAPPQTLYRAP